METKELLEDFLEIVDKNNKNLVSIAFDEMESSQYEEAAAHFDQLYVQDSNDYMSYFFRAYCKSYCGTRGNVYPDSQKLTSAFELACKKACASKVNLEINLPLLIMNYRNAMDNLAYNAVEEVKVDSNGNTHTSNPTKHKIYADARRTLVQIYKENINVIKECDKLKEAAITYLKSVVNHDVVNIGALIVSYDPSYSATYESKLKMLKVKKLIGTIIIIGIVVVIAVAVIRGMAS